MANDTITDNCDRDLCYVVALVFERRHVLFPRDGEVKISVNCFPFLSGQIHGGFRMMRLAQFVLNLSTENILK